MDTIFGQHGLSCEECGAGRVLLDERRQELICENCGLIVDGQTFEMDPGYKTDNSGNLIGQQHGPPYALGSGAMVGSTFYLGKLEMPKSPSAEFAVRRLKRTATRNSRDRSMPREAAATIRDLAGKLHLSRAVVDRATFILRAEWKLRRTNAPGISTPSGRHTERGADRGARSGESRWSPPAERTVDHSEPLTWSA